MTDVAQGTHRRVSIRNTCQAIARNGEIGIRRSTGEFEQFTNFYVDVKGYISDGQRVIGFVYVVVAADADPQYTLDLVNEEYPVMYRHMCQPEDLLKTLLDPNNYCQVGKEGYVVQYMRRIGQEYMDSDGDLRRFFPIDRIGPTQDGTWVLSKEVHMDTDGKLIAKAMQHYVLMGARSSLDISDNLDFDNGQSLRKLFRCQKNLFGNNFAAIVMIHGAALVATHCQDLMGRTTGLPVPIIMGAAQSGKTIAAKSVLALYGVSNMDTDISYASLMGALQTSPWPLLWDDVDHSMRKDLGKIVVVCYHSAGRSRVGEREKTLMLPILTTNMWETFGHRIDSRLARIYFKAPSPRLGRVAAEAAEEALSEAMRSAVKSIGTALSLGKRLAERGDLRERVNELLGGFHTRETKGMALVGYAGILLLTQCGFCSEDEAVLLIEEYLETYFANQESTVDMAEGYEHTDTKGQ